MNYKSRTHILPSFLYFLFIYVLISSCEPKPIDLDDFEFHVTEYVELDTLHSEDIVESYRYIQLESKNNTLIGEVKGLKVADDKLFVLSQDVISVFDMEGMFLFNIDAIGGGPGEYSKIADWSIDNGIVYIYDDNKYRIELFDSNSGKHLNSIKTPYAVSELEIIDNRLFADRITIPNELIENSNRLFTADLNNLGRITSFYPSEREDVPNNWHQLFAYNKQVYFLSTAFNKMYKVKKNQVIPYIYFDFGQKNITPDVLADNKNVSKRYNGDYWFGITNIYENSTYIFGSILNGTHENRYLLFNKNTGKNIIVKTDAVKNYPYRHVTAPDAVYKEEFYKIHPLWVIKFMKYNTESKSHLLTDEQKSDDGYKKLSTTNIEIDDNPWVAVYKLKDDLSILKK